MGTDDDARKAQVRAIMAGGQDSINEYQITGIMALAEKVNRIEANCCARGCSDQARESQSGQSIMHVIHGSGWGGALSLGVYVLGKVKGWWA